MAALVGSATAFAPASKVRHCSGIRDLLDVDLGLLMAFKTLEKSSLIVTMGGHIDFCFLDLQILWYNLERVMV